MKYLTLHQLATHAAKSPSAVSRALKAAGIAQERITGVRGKRISVAVANKFLARQWPGVEQIKAE